MNDDHPSYFITWTVYGTFLQGDQRGWRKRTKGVKTPQPLLAAWRAERLKYPVIHLDEDHRSVVETEIARLCEFRSWKLWALNARSNHVHVAVFALNYRGNVVRDQLKANCTRVLRESWPQFVDRPVWTEGGDWQCVNDDDELESVIQYISESQDRKGEET